MYTNYQVHNLSPPYFIFAQYLQEIWQGHLDLKAWQFLLFFAVFVLLPPVWLVLSIPVEKGLNRVPVVKVGLI